MGAASAPALKCPRCGGRGVRYGWAWRRDGRHQRYRCTACGRIYLGGRPLSNPGEEPGR